MPTDTSADKTVFERRESEARSYCRSFDTVFTKALGSELTDADGKTYIDFLAGCSSLNYGHNDPDMKAALIEHISGDGIAHGLDMYTTEKARFLKAYEDNILKPRGMDHKIMMTGPTGTNAVEAAMKLARKVKGRNGIISFTNGFHGMTLGSLAATANAYFRNAAGVPLNHIERLPFGHTLEHMREAYNDSSSGYEEPAAVLVEVIQAEGGVNVATQEWLKDIRQFARDHGALFIIDDIQAGCGRTGSYFSFDGMDLDPDIITLAKGIGGFGTPLAMNLNKPEHDKHWSPGEHTGTFRGQGISFVAGKVAMEYFKGDDFMKEVRRKGEMMQDRLQDMAGPGMEVRGKGMIWGVDTKDGAYAKKVVAESFRTGLLLGGCGTDGRVAKLIPPLTIPDEDLTEGLDLLEKAMQSVMEPA